MPQDNTVTATDTTQMTTTMPSGDDTTYATDASAMSDGVAPAGDGSTAVPYAPTVAPDSSGAMPDSYVAAPTMPTVMPDVVAPVQEAAVPMQGATAPMQNGGFQAQDETMPMQDFTAGATAPAEAPAEEAPISEVVVVPGQEQAEEETQTVKSGADMDIRSDIAAKIGDNKNILIALSSDPSVDELAAAIGLSLYLDKIGKRATAIYSGATPNTLEFLKPGETFEPSADTLQDFVIAINKDKADHLRYKLDGEYVKVFITPYKHRLSEDDLEFSYGDYNVDLVIALDVANGIDLDSALREHGRIMHDASIINVTTGNPGKFGEIEWSDKKASSVSEMIAELLYQYGGENEIAKDEATAFLTGVVAATNRFSNARTTPETMRLASRLMESGANQVLVSKNITPDTDNELFNTTPVMSDKPEDTEESDEEGETKKKTDPTKLDIEHKYEKAGKENGDEKSDDEESSEVDADVTKKEHTLLDDLKAAEESLAHAGEETTPEKDKTLKIENGQIAKEPETEESEKSGLGASTTDTKESEPEPELPPVLPSLPSTDSESSDSSEEAKPEKSERRKASWSFEDTSPMPGTSAQVSLPDVSISSADASSSSSDSSSSDTSSDSNGLAQEKPELTINPSAGFDAEASDVSSDKYSQMIEDALKSTETPAAPQSAPVAPVTEATPGENPATVNAPAAASAPEINGVPEMNFMPMPGTEILPPPPAPPIGDLGAGALPGADVPPVAPIESVAPVSKPTPVGEQPATDQADASQQNDPGAFRIPGM